MKSTLQTILIMLVLAAIGVTWWQFGGTVLAIILGTIGLTALLAIAFLLGGRWTFKAIETGARIAVQSSAVNDQHDEDYLQRILHCLPPFFIKISTGWPRSGGRCRSPGRARVG